MPRLLEDVSPAAPAAARLLRPVVRGRTRSSRIGPLSLGAYELALSAWRPLERRLRPQVGLSLIVRARRPAAG